jgi:hypothetical protein
MARMTKLEAELHDLRVEVERWRSLYLDQPEDRLYHASDNSWWRRDDTRYTGIGSLVRAEPPPGWVDMGDDGAEGDAEEPSVCVEQVEACMLKANTKFAQMALDFTDKYGALDADLLHAALADQFQSLATATQPCIMCDREVGIFGSDCLKDMIHPKEPFVPPPSDDGGWNDATAANHARSFPNASVAYVARQRDALGADLRAVRATLTAAIAEIDEAIVRTPTAR